MRRLALVLGLLVLGCANDPQNANGDDAGVTVVNCDQRDALCRVFPPECSGESVPEVASTCWTGECVPVEECECAEAEECPEGFTCNGTRCG